MAKKPDEAKKPDDEFRKLVAGINKDSGDGTVMFGSDDIVVDVDCIPSGSIAINIALGVGGWPRGRIVEVYGPESSGKTTLLLAAIAECQANGGNACFIDAEHAFDPEYAERIGVQLDKLAIHQPDHGEQALMIAEMMAKSGIVDLVVIDSVPALVPKAELEGTLENQHMAALPRLMSTALRRITPIISKGNTCLVFINQIREKVGVTFGSNETTPGGRALKFFASIRVGVKGGKKINQDGKAIEMMKEGMTIIGREMKVQVVKNKVAPPFRRANVQLMFDKENGIYGVNKYAELVDEAANAGVLNSGGSHYSYGDLKLGHGKLNAANALKEDQDLYKKVRDELYAQVMPKKGELDFVDEDEVNSKVEEQDDME